MNSGKICVSVAGATGGEMIEKIRQAERFADVIEVRFDSLDPNEFERANEIIAATKLPIISTFRPKDQGGYRELSLAEREAFWASARETAFCDVEADIAGKTGPQRLWGERICSYHDHSGVPENIEHLFDHLANTNTEVVKIAAQADEITDAIPVWKLLERARSIKRISRPKVIPIAMGEAGKWTRILGLAHGAYLTYASLEQRSATAAGQLSVEDLVKVYRVKELDPRTRVYGVIGDPISGSLSPYIHNAAFVATGINAVFITLEVKNLYAFLTRMVLPATREVELNFAGFAVTMPHKAAVITYLDEIDAEALRIGAVNTITITDGQLYGSNTDTVGFITPLEARSGPLDGLRVAVLGAGGAARACVNALKKARAGVTVFARNEGRSRKFAAEFSIPARPISDLRSLISNYDVLVNATPMGMNNDHEDASPLTVDELKGVKLVFDLVTSPKDTPLIRAAKQAGAETIGGIEMLIEQAVRQFEIWTGRDAPREVMHAAALARMESS